MRRSAIPVIVACALALAAPASAQGPVEGVVETVENIGWEVGPCPGIGWVGTLDISGSDGMDGTYGFELFHRDFGNDTNSVFAEDDWWRWSEYFAVRDALYEFDEEGFIVDCEPGAVLLQGYDTGVGSLALNEFWDTGYVAEASGPFEGLTGARTFQLGEFTAWNDAITMPDGNPSPTAFKASFRVE
jgi:hypothetical protein